jgi:protein-tyrosine kinase
MSKIEKALNKARSSAGSLRVVHDGREATGQSLATVSSSTTVSVSDVEHRAISSKMISRMRDITPIDKKFLAQHRIIFPEMGKDDTVRAFREIRTKIIQKSQGKNCSIMVTSLLGGGGSSFVAMNLAAAFAFDGSKTALFIECNLRKPYLHKLFAGKKAVFHGLTDYLEHPDMDASEIIHPVGIARLRVIPSGNQREVPAEYFTSLKMKRLMDEIQQRYPERYIILDAPPMTESADAQILADLCDYVLLVVPYGKVTDSQIDASVKAIGEKKLFGVVFNNEPVLPPLRWLSILNPFVALWGVLFRSNSSEKNSAAAK